MFVVPPEQAQYLLWAFFRLGRVTGIDGDEEGIVKGSDNALGANMEMVNDGEGEVIGTGTVI